VSAEPILVLGEGRGGEADEFFRVNSVRFFQSGSIVMTNGGTAELRAFDKDGKLLFSSGGRGEGPGEYQEIRTVDVIRGDTLVVWDVGLRRITVLRPDGEVASTISVSLAGEDVELVGEITAAVPSGIAVLADTLFVVTPAPPVSLLTGLRATGGGRAGVDPAKVQVDGVYRLDVPLFLLDRSGSVVRRSEAVPGDAWFLRNGQANYLQLGPRLSVGAGDDVMIAGNGENLTSPFSTGPSTWLPTGLVRRPITERMWNDRLEAILASFTRSPSTRSYFQAMPAPDSLPVFGGLLVGAEGRVWVQEYLTPEEVQNGGSQVWHTIDRVGRSVRRVELPAELAVMDFAEGRVVGVHRDSLGVERILVYALHDESW
jgi:hypothetical protein